MRTEPCGTPAVIARGEEMMPWQLIQMERLVRKERSHLQSCGQTPSFGSLTEDCQPILGQRLLTDQ